MEQILPAFWSRGIGFVIPVELIIQKYNFFPPRVKINNNLIIIDHRLRWSKNSQINPTNIYKKGENFLSDISLDKKKNAFGIETGAVV